jgi:hypothetical protein
MSDYDEKNCACGGKKRISNELENDMHVEDVASEERRELAYICRKKRHLVG